MADEPTAFNLDDIDFGPTMRGHQKGDRVFDRFVLQKLLGRGGMGVVWLALDERLRRDVALKFAPQMIRFDEVAVEELKEETRKGLDLSHPHIVKTYDFLLDEDHAAISMEFIDGESLSGKRAKQPKRIFEVRELELWAAQLLDALQYAHHHAGVIHRDLKPANLMVDRQGTLRITDFGIARSITDAINRATLAGGNSTGTLAYMSPQQADGRKPQITDDIYAFASTMYELLTGKPPFHSGNIGLQLRHEAPVSLTARRAEFGLTDVESIPPVWEETLLACLSKDPAQRPANADDVAQLLGLALHQTRSGNTLAPTMPPPQSAPSMPPPPPGSADSASPTSSHTAPPTRLNTEKPWRQTHPTKASQKLPPPPPVKDTATSASATETPSQSNHLWFWIILGLMFSVMVALGGAGWWVYKKGTFFKFKPEVVQTTTNVDDPVEADPITSSPPQETAPAPKPEPLASTTPATEPEPTNMQPASTTPEPPPLTPEAPAGFTTIQNAIKQAKPGDTISIPDGVYRETIRLATGIRLKAENAGKVVVEVDGESSSALLVENVRDTGIEGMVFQHIGSEVSADRKWPVIYVKSSSLAITACTVERGVGDGITITGGGKVEVRQSVFRNNFSSGMIVESGATPLIIDCKFQKNGGNGVTVRFTGTSPVIEGGEFDGNGGSGVVVNDRASVKITGNVIATKNGEAGIAADGDGSSLQVEGAECSGNRIGVSVHNAATGIIRNTKILNNNEQGLTFMDAGDQSIAEKNTVQGNKGDGIFVAGIRGGSLRLTGNDAIGNAGYGILLIGAGFKPEVTENQCLKNALEGMIVAEGCEGTITANTVKDNHLPGIKINEAPQAIVRDNLLE